MTKKIDTEVINGVQKNVYQDDDSIHIERSVETTDLEKDCQSERDSFTKFGDGMHKVASIPLPLWHKFKAIGMSDKEILLAIQSEYPAFMTVKSIYS